MGKLWGNMIKVRGIVQYSISPFEQKAFAGAISEGIPRTFRRFTETVFRVGPPVVIGYLIWDWADREYARLSRKNPKDYENDV